MAERCPQCGKSVVRVQARVRVLNTVWIERVAAIHCPRCRVAKLTASGQAKVNRGIVAATAMMGPASVPWTPVMTFRSSNGELCEKELDVVGG